MIPTERCGERVTTLREGPGVSLAPRSLFFDVNSSMYFFLGKAIPLGLVEITQSWFFKEVFWVK